MNYYFMLDIVSGYSFPALTKIEFYNNGVKVDPSKLTLVATSGGSTNPSPWPFSNVLTASGGIAFFDWWESTSPVQYMIVKSTEIFDTVKIANGYNDTVPERCIKECRLYVKHGYVDPTKNDSGWKLRKSHLTADGTQWPQGLTVQTELVPIIAKKYLIQLGTKYYTIKSNNYDTVAHQFAPISLSNGSTLSDGDVSNFGFDDIANLAKSMTVGSDTFVPVEKIKQLGSNVKIRMFKEK